MAIAARIPMITTTMSNSISVKPRRDVTCLPSGRQRAPTLRHCHRVGALWRPRSEEHTSELQSLAYLVCRLLLEKKNKETPCEYHTAEPSIQSRHSTRRDAM